MFYVILAWFRDFLTDDTWKSFLTLEHIKNILSREQGFLPPS